MSYFLVATGAVPLIDDIPALSFVPTAQAQAYVADIVSETVESCDRAVTYLLDDGTQTSDEVIAESSEQIVGRCVRDDAFGTGRASTPRGWLHHPRLVAFCDGRSAETRCL